MAPSQGPDCPRPLAAFRAWPTAAIADQAACSETVFNHHVRWPNDLGRLAMADMGSALNVPYARSHRVMEGLFTAASWRNAADRTKTSPVVWPARWAW
jgi:hypothetical protein